MNIQDGPSKENSICEFKNIRICVDKALVILPFENELNFYRKIASVVSVTFLFAIPGQLETKTATDFYWLNLSEIHLYITP